MAGMARFAVTQRFDRPLDCLKWGRPENIRKVEVLMPDSWDPERYKERAKAWRDKAASFPEGRERDACVTLAEGYEKLAELIEAQRPCR
jgi:hypothetical protein